MKRRNFLASLFVVPTALKRLAKDKPKPKGQFIAAYKYAVYTDDATMREMIFHQRDYTGTWKFEMKDL